MAENTEIDAINHLLEVEKNASALINDAAQEADRRLSDAHSKYNAAYKPHYRIVERGIFEMLLKPSIDR